jgi:NADH-quinone oxidoreductase subunit C
MSNSPAITDLEQIKFRSAVSALIEWNSAAVKGGKFDRNELTLIIESAFIRDACFFLRDRQAFNFMSDLTCVDMHPREPRFEVIYHLLSHSKKERIRLKVQLPADDPVVESIVPVWPTANFFEREIFDLFGVRFLGHPNLKRIMMPDDWKGNPLRKDYPVEGYR